MSTFSDFNISKQLQYGLDELGFKEPTPVQETSFPIIMSGKDIIGIAQTGTGKTLAYSLPILQQLKYSNQKNPRVLILVPTRELVLQVVKNIDSYASHVSIRTLGVYGGTNINTQGQLVAQGCDILVATPGRLYDLALTRVLSLKDIKKFVIDEVDVMLDLGFIFQLTNILELLPDKRQNILFSATMTQEVDEMIQEFFVVPEKVSIAVSGTPLENIKQTCFAVENFYTKVNLLTYLIKEKHLYPKVLVFVSTKKRADLLFELLEESRLASDCCVIHSNKSQNYRIRSIEEFDSGQKRILIATDVMARGLDLDKISHVINFDTPDYPENYMHRIGRTGRAKNQGNTILFYTETEKPLKESIETLMKMKIDEHPFPEEVEINPQRTAEENPNKKYRTKKNRHEIRDFEGGGAFHEKSEKNQKVNLGGKYRRELAEKYKKPQRKGDKIQNLRAKKKKRK